MGNLLHKEKKGEPAPSAPVKKSCHNCKCSKSHGEAPKTQTPAQVSEPVVVAAPSPSPSPVNVERSEAVATDNLVEEAQSVSAIMVDTKGAEVVEEASKAAEEVTIDEPSVAVKDDSAAVEVPSEPSETFQIAPEAEEAQVPSGAVPTVAAKEESLVTEEQEPGSTVVAEEDSKDDTPAAVVTEEASPEVEEAIITVEEFSMANQKLKLNSEADVATYVETIKANPHIKRLFFNGNSFSVDACKALAEAVSTLNEIEEINLSDCFTGRMKEEVHVSVAAFNEILKNKSSLRKVDFSDNAFGPVGARAMAILLAESTGLAELVLNNNGLGPEGGKIIAQALLDCQKLNQEANRESSLRRVEIGRNRLENGSSELMTEALAAHGLIREVAFPQNGIRPEGIVTISKGLAANKHLEKVNLQDNTFTKVGSIAFASALKDLKNLSILNIGDCLLGAEGCIEVIKALIESGCPIESLNLQYNEMNDEGVQLLISSFEQSSLASLKLLMLNGNCFNPVGNTAEALKDHLATVGLSDILDNWSDMEYYSDEDDEDLSEDGSDVDKEDITAAAVPMQVDAKEEEEKKEEQVVAEISQLELKDE